MHFVRSSVYQQEITEKGVEEKEIATRTKEEIELEERLKSLPEFQRRKDENFILKNFLVFIWEKKEQRLQHQTVTGRGKKKFFLCLSLYRHMG